jgi:hypothetical protein
LQEPQDQILQVVMGAPKISDAMIAKVQPNFDIDGLFTKQLWK